MTETGYGQTGTNADYRGSGTDSESQTVDADGLLSLLDDESARAILKTISDDGLSAREIADRLGLSRPTVYRRLNRLEEIGAVRASMAYDPNGHHRKQYRTTLDRVVLSISTDSIGVNQAT